MTINNHLNGLIVAIIITPQCLAADSVKRVEQTIVGGGNITEYTGVSQVLSFDIPSKPLDEALDAFIEATDWQISFSAALTQGLTGRAVKGQYHPEQVLELMLQGSGLTYRMTGDGIVILEPETVELPEPHIPDVDLKLSRPKLRPLILEEMTVTGKSKLGNDKKSYSAIYTSSATRTNTPIREIPQSIQVITPALIADQQTITISESLQNVSGVVNGNPLLTPEFEWTLIRGFPSEQLLDGFSQYYNPGDRESTINVDRIEVLKGSNALLYGGGSGSPAGGLINVISKLPQLKAFGLVGIKIGSYQLYQPFFDFNQPVNENILFRITGEYTHSESHVDVLKTQRFNINPALTLTDNDATTFRLQGKASKWEQQDYQGLPATGTVSGDFKIRSDTFIGPANIEPSSAEFYAVWGALGHRFNDIWSVTLKGRYSQSKFDQKTRLIFGRDAFQADQPFLSPSIWLLTNSELFQEQQEISFAAHAIAEFALGPTENTLLFGADYSQIDDRGFIEFNTTEIASVDLKAPAFPIPYTEPGLRENNLFVTNTTYGGYVQLQSTLYDRLHVLVGLRLGNITIDYENTIPGFQFSVQSGKTRVLPRFGAVFDVTEEFSLFASYSEGMRGQRFNNFTSAPNPERSRQIEAGVKFDIASQLSGQFAFYQIKRSNAFIADNTQLSRTSLIGEQQSQGFEIDLSWQASNAINILATYAYTDAEFVNSIGGISKGTSLPGVPEHAGRLWANYRFQQPLFKGLSMGVGIYAQSGVYLSNAHLFKSKSYYTIDSSISYEIDRFKLAVSVKNLTDQSYFERLDYLGSRVAPGQGVSLFTMLSFAF